MDINNSYQFLGKLKQKQVDVLLKMVYEYKTTMDISREMSIPQATLYNWIHHDSEFKRAYKLLARQATEERMNLYKESVISSHELAEIARKEAKEMLRDKNKASLKKQEKIDLIRAVLQDEKQMHEANMDMYESENLIQKSNEIDKKEENDG